jgi:hypothetical protein
MRILSSVRIALAATLLGACGPNFEAMRGPVTEQHNNEMAREKDPDARAWLQGYFDCGWGANAAPAEDWAARSKCYVTNEEKTVASLRSQADNEKRPTLKEALTKAVTCIEKAHKMPPTNPGEKTFGMYPDVKACLGDKSRAMSKEAASEDEDYAAAEKDGGADAWLAFIAKHRDDKRVPAAVKAIVTASAKAGGEEQSAIEDKLASTYPPGVAQLSAERRILLVGPKGLRVKDLAKLTTSKVSPSIVVARVKASPEPYKNFDGEELGALKQLGLADEVVTAMIEVTTKLEDKKKADDERQALRTELAALRKMIEEKQASGAKTGGQTVQTKDGPMDVLASCAKRLAAMNVCENLPFPGSTICKSTAESEFPCPGQN